MTLSPSRRTRISGEAPTSCVSPKSKKKAPPGTKKPMAVEIIAPEGSLVNARAPAPMTMCTVFPAHEIMHACWWALGQADPDNPAAFVHQPGLLAQPGMDEAADAGARLPGDDEALPGRRRRLRLCCRHTRLRKCR